VSFTGAVAVVLLLDLLSEVFPSFGESFVAWGAASAMYFLLAILIGRLFDPNFSWYLFLMFAGIGVGFFVDAALVEIYLNKSRNLWPLGAVLYWILGCVPMMLGLLLGERWQRHRLRTSH
jgi:hypothetical protein